MTKTELKVEFIKQYKKYITRDGADEFLSYLESSDFFDAPASSRFHCSFEGGLCLHSLNVFMEMIRLLKVYPEISTRKDGTRVSGETVAIISLLHDVCKIENYVVSMRNVKEDGKWIQKPYYEFKENLSVGGHGAKSVYLITKYMKLTDEEAAAIMCHMGTYEFNEKYGNVSNAYNQFPLAWLLHVADESASYIKEREE